MQAIINKVHPIAQADYVVDTEKYGLFGHPYSGFEVVVSTGSANPSLAGYNRRVAMPFAQGVDPTEKDYAEAESQLDITRKFWYSMGAKSKGAYTHLLRLKAMMEDEIDNDSESEEFGDLLQVKGVKRKREENAPGPSRFKRPTTEPINRFISVEMEDYDDGT